MRGLDAPSPRRGLYYYTWGKGVKEPWGVRRAPRGGGSCFVSIPRDLRGPGLRAYFCRAAKVGKNALRKLRFLRTFLNYGGNYLRYDL